MNIPENFDRWMFDYKEGNLSGAELQEFENFLIQNPEFEIEADAWENAFIRNEEFVYADAHKLEKNNRFAGYYGYATAALLLLLLGGSTLFVLNSGDTKGIAGFEGNSTGVVGDESSHSNILPSTTTPEALNNNDETNSGSDVYGSFGQNGANGSNHYVAVNTVNGTNGSNGTVNSQYASNTANNSNQNPNNSYVYSNEAYKGSSSSNSDIESLSDAELAQISMDQETAKFDSEENSAKYLGNPSSSGLNFEISKKKKVVKYSSFKNKVKRFYRKIERQMGYPVDLINLRDPQISIPQSNLLSSNPSFAGGALKPRFEMNYRNQWFGSNMNSQSMSIGFDDYSSNLRGGYGVLINATDFGLGGHNDVSASLFYSPKIALSKNFVLEPAVKLTIGSVSVNTDKVAGHDQIEVQRGRTLDMSGGQNLSGTSRLWYKDIGVGAMVNSKWFYAGFSADNLGGHYENAIRGEQSATPSFAPTRITGIIGTDIEGRLKPIRFSPFIAYDRFDKRNELWGGFDFALNWFTVGGSVSSNLDFTASAGIQVKMKEGQQFRLVYRYDQTDSQLLTNPVGSHSIGLRISGRTKRNQRLPN